MKKVLIFYGSYGGGHLSAAKAIGSFLEQKYEKDVEVKLVDCIEYISKSINKVSTEAYKELAKKAPWAWKRIYKQAQNGALSHISTATNKLMAFKLNSLLKEFNPDLIVSTHPFSTQMCAIIKKRENKDYKLATVLTDYHIHPQWLVLSQYTNYFFVSNETMKIDMIKEGIPEEKIFVTGIPVSDRFSQEFDTAEIHKEFGLDPEKPTILFFAGGEFGLGRDTTYMVLKALIKMFKGLQVVAISGKNKKMNKKFNELVQFTKSENRVKILEYTNKVPELMHISIGIITKPGGLTITEALVSKLPIVIINPIPGQEEENAEFLVNNNVAVWIKPEDKIARTLKYLSRNAEKLQAMGENARLLSKPNATEDICKIIMHEFNDVVKIPNQLMIEILIKCRGKYLFIKPKQKSKDIVPPLHLLGGPLPNDQILDNSLNSLALKEMNIELKNLKPFDFDTEIQKYKGRESQIIYLRYLADINSSKDVITTSDNYSLIWLSKDELKGNNFTNTTKNLLKKLNLI